MADPPPNLYVPDQTGRKSIDMVTSTERFTAVNIPICPLTRHQATTLEATSSPVRVNST